MTTTEQQAAAQQKATGLADGLRQLADMIEANPDIQPVYLTDMHVWCPRNVDEIRAIIRAAKASGATVEKTYSDSQANVGIRFGALRAMALVSREQVCERVVVGQETVQVPDPAFIPPTTPLIEKTVDVTEWRCRPIMDEVPA